MVVLTAISRLVVEPVVRSEDTYRHKKAPTTRQFLKSQEGASNQVFNKSDAWQVPISLKRMKLDASLNVMMDGCIYRCCLPNENSNLGGKTRQNISSTRCDGFGFHSDTAIKRRFRTNEQAWYMHSPGLWTQRLPLCVALIRLQQCRRQQFKSRWCQNLLVTSLPLFG